MTVMVLRGVGHCKVIHKKSGLPRSVVVVTHEPPAKHGLFKHGTSSHTGRTE